MNDLQIQKEKMIDTMYNLGYSDDTVKKYRLRIDKYISYLEANLFEASKETADSFCTFIIETSDLVRSKTNYLKETKCFIYKFVRFIEDGYLTYREPHKSFKFNGIYGESINQFLDEELKILSSVTVTGYKAPLYQFQNYLISNGITELNSKCISDFFLDFSRKNKSQHAYYRLSTVMKKYLRFLFSRRIISDDLSEFVPKVRYIRSSELPSVYTDDEIKSILNSIDRTSDIGKRNYAMLTLAVFLGLRCSDIINLKFENINWEKSTINLKMVKTKKDITLPLLPEIGNAILDYLQYGRRKCDIDYVFISGRGAIAPVSSSTFYNVVKNHIRKAGIKTSNRKEGPHTLRHSLATRLLKQGEPLPLISEALGHSDTQVTTVYTSIDFESLKACALEVLPIKSQAYDSEVF